LEAGTPADEPRNIQVIDVVVVESELGGAFREPLKCDSEGSVYVRGYDAVLRSKIPIRKFDTQKGVRLASFSLDSAPGLEFETGDEFFVAPDGELYWLTATKSERYILTFAKDGTFKGKVKLEFGKPFLPYQLAVFAGGEFLISGLNPEDPGKKSDKKPFTGIFDKQGRLVKRIALQDDDAIHEAAQRGDSNFTSELYPGQGNRAVSQGAVVGSSDGNVYLMRRTSPALIYAISPAGTVVRRISVDSGDPALFPMEVHGVEGRLAIMFWNRVTGESLFKIVETQTGDVIATYANQNLFGFTCYTLPQRFTFLSTSKGKLAFAHAEPQ